MLQDLDKMSSPFLLEYSAILARPMLQCLEKKLAMVLVGKVQDLREGVGCALAGADLLHGSCVVVIQDAVED
jgi:hypothetical protein